VRYVDRIRTYYRILVQATEDSQGRPEIVAGDGPMDTKRSVVAM